jgi:hypothetical protein
VATLDVSPTKVRPNETYAISFIGGGTSWLSTPPTFTPSGLAGVSAGSVTVVSDVLATAPVTFPAAGGVVTWTDSTTSATRNQLVMSYGLLHTFIPRRRRNRLADE